MTTSLDSPQRLLIINAGRSPLFDAGGQSVRCENGQIVDIDTGLSRRPGEQVLDAGNRALIPGLHDQHIHLLATAAEAASLNCNGLSRDGLKQAIRNRIAIEPGEWLRGVNYHETIAGDLDRHQLDQWSAERPVRLQHASGVMWYLNTQAIAALRLNQPENRHHPEIQRDAQGQATGQLFRGDGLVAELLRRYDNNKRKIPSLATLSATLAGFGVTGVTDTSYRNSDSEFAALQEKQRSGELLQRLRIMGDVNLTASHSEHIHTGELKIMLDESSLPDLDQLEESIRNAHQNNRAVAVHCVTEIELATVLSVFTATGCKGDRIEHASVVPARTLKQISDLGLAVVTQPGFIQAKGDRYLNDLDDTQRANLYRLRSLEAHNIPLALSSDAPYGPLNPWLNMQCAVDRTTAAGERISPGEGLTPESALAAYCCPAKPGIPQRLDIGGRADLAILSKSWDQLREDLAGTRAEATCRAGYLIHQTSEI